ncbi:MAG: ABC transporter ATP-binding protein, partial [Deltaproteobacteria bacterium]|nr:ABC transporter ATP-binding protein [Deltaproteobacteria bacterium]
MSHAAIGAQGVTKVFRATAPPVWALDGVSFDVGDSEFVVVVGRSGCGKTTLLKILAGLTPLSRGRVLIGGKEVRGPVGNIGMVFQTPVLLPWRSVLDNVLLPIEVMGRRTAEHERKARELIELTGLQGFEERPPRALSGGMQQRVSICRALIYDPPILLMDEPFGALDAMTREEMNGELLRIWQQRRKTVVLVTHSISEAVFLADRVIVMTPRPGRIRKVFEIALPRPRTMKVKTDPAFVRYEQ